MAWLVALLLIVQIIILSGMMIALRNDLLRELRIMLKELQINLNKDRRGPS
jgi:hypothetical protein